ncbi:kinase-like domain-containing protein, partial [Mycena olivaceomarginata]
SSSTARPLLSKALIRLSRAAKLHPRCFPLAGVEKIGNQVAAGAFGDIWQGKVQGQNAFGREALIWRQLSHPNLLPFFGLYYVDNRLSLVSPWMENGHLLEFLRQASTNINHLCLISDVAMGLEYLHTNHIVHGDLKGVCDFAPLNFRNLITDYS